MAKKENQISVKVDDRLLSIIDDERYGTERSRAAQIRWMIERYLEIRTITTPIKERKDQTAM